MERLKQNTVASNAEQQCILFVALDGFDHDYQASANFPLNSVINKSPPQHCILCWHCKSNTGVVN